MVDLVNGLNLIDWFM